MSSLLLRGFVGVGEGAEQKGMYNKMRQTTAALRTTMFLQLGKHQKRVFVTRKASDRENLQPSVTTG